MAGKSFSVSFNINGSMDGSLAAALQNAANAMRGLGNAAKTASASAQASKSGLQGMANALNQLSTGAAKFKALDAALKQTTADFSKSTAALNAAKENFNQQSQAAEKLRQKLAELQAERDKVNRSRDNERATLKGLREQRRALKDQFGIVKTSDAEHKVRDSKGAGEYIKKLNELTAQLRANQTAIENQRAKFQETGKAYSDLTTKIKQAKAELKPLAEAEKQSGDSLAQVRRNAEQLKQSFQQQLGALNQLKAALSSAGVNVSHLAQEESRLQGEINRVNAALERQAVLNQARANSSAAAQEMFSAYNNFQNALQTAETIASPFKAAIDNASEFEYAMSQVKALTQMRNIRTGDMERVRDEMEELRKEAERLGATTEFTSLEVAKAMGYYGMAGWDKNRIISAMQSTLDLATIAGDHNIPRTADVFSDAMTALGMQAGRSMELTSGKIVEESAYFTDAFAYAITQANLNREQLFEALKYNAPTSHAAGLSLGETLAMNMISANAGIKGSMAGTAFRAGWTRFLAPPKTAAKALAEMGMTASDATREVLEAGAALESIGVSAESDLFTKITKAYEHYQTLDKNGKAGFLTQLVGRNALSAWQSVFDTGNIEKIAAIAQEIDSGAIEGWAKYTADVMRDNTKTSIELLESSIDALQNRIGTALLPTVRATAEAFAPIVTAAAEWVAENPAVVQAAAAIAATLATVIVAAAGVKLAFAGWSFVTAQIALVRAALASLGESALIGGLIGRLGALQAALFGMGGAATLGGWSAMFAAISARAAAASAAVVNFFASFSLSSMAAGAVSILKKIGTAILGVSRAALAFAFSPVGVALMALALAGLYCYQNWDKVAPVLSNIAGIITSSLSGAMAAIGVAISNVTKAFDNLAGNGALSKLGMIITGVLATVVTGIAGVLATVINVAGAIISAVANIIADIINLIQNVLSGNWSAAWENFKDIGIHAFEGIADVARGILDGISATIKGIADAWAYLRGEKVASGAHGENNGGGGGSFSATAETAQAVAPTIDTAPLQLGIDTAGAAMQSTIYPTQSLSTALMSASPATQALAISSQGAATSTDALSNSAAGSTGNIDAMSGAASGSTGNINSMSGAAGSASGSISGLGAAAQSAINSLLSAGSAAASAVSSAASSALNSISTMAMIKADSNAEGGIYGKGTFLTTFAEKTPEAAIPIEHSARAFNLWRQTGSLLGVEEGAIGEVNRDSWALSTLENSSPINITFNVTIEGNADENVVRRGFEQALPRVRDFASELAAYQHERARRSFA